MKTAGILLLIVLTSVGSSLITASSLDAKNPGTSASKDSALELELERLMTRIASIESRAEQAASSEALVAPSPARATRIAVGDIEQAVDAWMRENLGAAYTATDGVETMEGEPIAEQETIQQVVQAILSGDTVWNKDELWARLREEGRVEEVIAEFERLALEDPHNPDAHVALGGAYIQQLFGVGNTPEAGKLALKADKAFDSALDLEPNHWEARFVKGVSLSNWPAFLGKAGEAMQQFSILVEQQEQSPPMAHHAQTYLYLGNLHQQTGDLDKAREVWQRGLALHPGDETLAHQLTVNSGN